MGLKSLHEHERGLVSVIKKYCNTYKGTRIKCYVAFESKQFAKVLHQSIIIKLEKRKKEVNLCQMERL